MSTTVCIVHPNLNVIHTRRYIDGYANTDLRDFDEYYTAIGTRHEIYEEMLPIVLWLPEDTPIYSTDNEMDISTIGEYLNGIKTKRWT